MLLALWSTGRAPSDHGPVSSSSAATTGATLLLGSMGGVALSTMAMIYTVSPWSSSEPFVMLGATTEILENQDPKRRDLNAAYTWLRTSTAKTAYVFAPAVAKDDSLLPVIAQRRVVAQLASPFTRAIPHHEALLAANRTVLRSLRMCAFEPAVVDELRAVPVPWPNDLYALVEAKPASGVCDGSASSGFSLAYANDSYVVYRIPRL